MAASREFVKICDLFKDGDHKRMEYDLEENKIHSRFDIDEPNNSWNGRSLLSEAASDGDVEAIELLMKFGASIRKPSKIGNIPLHRAFASPSAALMLLLVMTKEDRAMKNEDGRTPLAFAYFNLFGAQGGGRIQQAALISERISLERRMFPLDPKPSDECELSSFAPTLHDKKNPHHFDKGMAVVDKRPVLNLSFTLNGKGSESERAFLNKWITSKTHFTLPQTTFLLKLYNSVNKGNPIDRFLLCVLMNFFSSYFQSILNYKNIDELFDHLFRYMGTVFIFVCYS